MAEARKEIVTALKFHRASMKQASERQQQQQQRETQLLEPSHQISLEQEAELKSRRNPRIYVANSLTPDNFPTSYQENFSYPPAATEEIPCMGGSVSAASEVAESGDSGLHPVMDDKEIAEIRSIADQYQMEWNDTLNLVNSAWWFKFVKAMEITPENQIGEDFVSFPFDEVMKFPAWLNTNDGCLQHANDFCSDNYFEDSALPCMDIEEIEGMGGDWLA